VQVPGGRVVTDILIKNGLVVTMDRRRRIIRDGAVAIEDARITAVGKTEKLEGELRADREIDAGGKAVLPGFVNVHTHLPSLFVRGAYGVVTDGLYQILFPVKEFLKPEYVYTFGLASCVEALAAGSTCVMETYNYISHFARATEEMGLRAVLGEQVLEADFSRVKDGVYEYLPDQGEKALERGVELVRRFEGEARGRIRTVLAPLAPDMCSTSLLLRVKDAAEKHKVGMTIHLAQSERELAQVRRLYGKTPAEYLRDLGYLTPRLSCAHCIHLTEEDMAIMKRSGASILHCPRPYLLSGETAPLLRWLEGGIPVGLGTDNVYHSMLETMRSALYAARLRTETLKEPFPSKRPTAVELLELATIRGAEVLGMQDEIGSLEPRKKADLIIVDLIGPHITPTIDPISSLVLYGQDSDIETVIVDGRVLKEGGKIRARRWREILRDAQDLADSIWGSYWGAHPEMRRVWQRYLTPCS
jgi:5-methylthioadenosine/S-adenosylhomocysteine deaminase